MMENHLPTIRRHSYKLLKMILFKKNIRREDAFVPPSVHLGQFSSENSKTG